MKKATILIIKCPITDKWQWSIGATRYCMSGDSFFDSAKSARRAARRWAANWLHPDVKVEEAG